MRVLALDQAQNITGYSVFDDTDLLKWGVINYSREDVEIRLPLMSNHIQVIMDKWKPDIVVFEGVALKDSVQRLIHLAQVQGCIMGMCFDRKIPYRIYQPTLWRKILEFEQRNEMSRRELKEQAVAFVKSAYGISVGDDTAEAICIALAYLKDSGMLPD